MDEHNTEEMLLVSDVKDAIRDIISKNKKAGQKAYREIITTELITFIDLLKAKAENDDLEAIENLELFQSLVRIVVSKLDIANNLTIDKIEQKKDNESEKLRHEEREASMFSELQKEIEVRQTIESYSEDTPIRTIIKDCQIKGKSRLRNFFDIVGKREYTYDPYFTYFREVMLKNNPEQNEYYEAYLYKPALLQFITAIEDKKTKQLYCFEIEENNIEKYKIAKRLLNF